MAEFLIGDVNQVREFTAKDLVNLHLVDGWVLLLVREGKQYARDEITGEYESVPATVYVIGWPSEAEPKTTETYVEEADQALI